MRLGLACLDGFDIRVLREQVADAVIAIVDFAVAGGVIAGKTKAVAHAREPIQIIVIKPLSVAPWLPRWNGGTRTLVAEHFNIRAAVKLVTEVKVGGSSLARRGQRSETRTRIVGARAANAIAVARHAG